LIRFTKRQLAHPVPISIIPIREAAIGSSTNTMAIVAADAKCVPVDPIKVSVPPPFALKFNVLIPLSSFQGLPSAVLFEGAPTIRLAHPCSSGEPETVDCYRLPEQPEKQRQPLLGTFSEQPQQQHQYNSNGGKNKSGLENGQFSIAILPHSSCSSFFLFRSPIYQWNDATRLKSIVSFRLLLWHKCGEEVWPNRDLPNNSQQTLRQTTGLLTATTSRQN
jgi:hypothetical protein